MSKNMQVLLLLLLLLTMVLQKSCTSPRTHPSYHVLINFFLSDRKLSVLHLNQGLGFSRTLASYYYQKDLELSLRQIHQICSKCWSPLLPKNPNNYTLFLCQWVLVCVCVGLGFRVQGVYVCRALEGVKHWCSNQCNGGIIFCRLLCALNESLVLGQQQLQKPLFLQANPLRKSA